jgi:hypothetical protein
LPNTMPIAPSTQLQKTGRGIANQSAIDIFVGEQTMAAGN